jgi:S-layer family protein
VDADVPTSHLYLRAIEALAASGITGGCGDGNFCPSQAVTRGELAKFLAVALGLHWTD